MVAKLVKNLQNTDFVALKVCSIVLSQSYNSNILNKGSESKYDDTLYNSTYSDITKMHTRILLVQECPSL